MKSRPLRLPLALLCGLALSMPVPVPVLAYDRDGDHDNARELYERGEIHSLQDILNTLRQHVPGEPIGVELVQRGGRWIYLIQVIAPDGRRLTVNVDAGDPPGIREQGGN